MVRRNRTIGGTWGPLRPHLRPGRFVAYHVASLKAASRAFSFGTCRGSHPGEAAGFGRGSFRGLGPGALVNPHHQERTPCESR